MLTFCFGCSLYIQHTSLKLILIMTGYAEMKRKASGLKNKIAGRFRKKLYDENPKERDVRPLLTNKKVSMTPWDEPEQLLSLNTKKNEHGKNQMSNFATAGSAVIATTFSEDTSSTQSSDLYRQRRSPTDGSRIVHPVVCKRDIYFGLGDDTNKSKNRKQNRDPGGRRESRGQREPVGAVRTGIHNKTENDVGQEKAPNLPSYSIAASMLCAKHDENGKIMPSTKNGRSILTSPPKPRGLPPNTIMASMLFRTLGHEVQNQPSTVILNNELEIDSFPPICQLNNEQMIEDEESDDEFDYEMTIPNAIANDRDYAQSSVSSVTMYSSYHNDPVVRASNNLYNLLRANHAAAQRIKTPAVDGLFEA
jgi:hypothetical protein